MPPKKVIITKKTREPTKNPTQAISQQPIIPLNMSIPDIDELIAEQPEQIQQIQQPARVRPNENNIKSHNELRQLILPKNLQKKPRFSKIAKIPKTEKDFFKNPITGNMIKNTYAARYRVNKLIEKKNREADERDSEILAEKSRERLRAKIGNLFFKDSFKGFFKLSIDIDNIDTLEELFNVLKNAYLDIVDTNKYIPIQIGMGWRLPENKFVYRTFSSDILAFDYSYFSQQIDEMELGNYSTRITGSDPVGEQADLYFNNVFFNIQQIAVVNASGENFIYKIEDVNKDSKKQDCMRKCLELCSVSRDEIIINFTPPNLSKDGFINEHLNKHSTDSQIKKIDELYPIYDKRQVNYKNNIDDLIDFIKKNKYPIKIISNTIKNLNISRIIKRPPILTKCLINKQANKQTNKNKNYSQSEPNDILITYSGRGLYKLENGDFEIQELLANSNPKFTLIYSSIDEHIDVITDNNPILLDNVYIDASGEVYKIIEGVGHQIYKARQILVDTTEKIDVEHIEYVFFDYETIIKFDIENLIKPYSLSYFSISHTELNYLTSREKFDINDEKTMEIYRSENAVNIIGFDCNDKFMDYIQKKGQEKTLIFVSYNGANFDNFILYQALSDYERRFQDTFRISNIQYNGNQLLNFKINGRHRMYDLNRHLAGSLDNNCKAFKLPAKFCKLSIDHNEIQMKYDSLGEVNFIEYMKETEKLAEYNNNDVFSLSILFTEYYKAFNTIKGFEFIRDKQFTNYITIGSIIFEKFKRNLKYNNIKLPKIQLKQYQEMLKYKSAGRVDVFRNRNVKILESMASMDCCSMYPYVMAILNVYYPCGEVKQANEYYKPNKFIGWYYCNIDQSNLKSKNLPNLYCEKVFNNQGNIQENDWESENKLFNYYISNIEIEQMRKYGVSVEIIDSPDNIYFTEKIKSCKLFGFILELMKLKNEQDIWKDTNDGRYNPALRETYKLLMNSMSGKVIEGLHTEQTKLIENYEDLLAISEKHNINVINNVGESVFVSYNVDEEDLINKQRPIYLGCLIYTYARGYMYDNLLSIIGEENCELMDTDALKFKSRYVNEWREAVKNKIVKHWPEVEKFDSRYKTHTIYMENSKVFGSFENEYKTNNLNYIMQKKFYMCANVVNGVADYVKWRGKGIRRNAIFLNGQEPIIKMGDNEDYIKVVSDEQINKYCFDNSLKEIGGDFSNKEGKLQNQLEFFETLHQNKGGLVLCRSLKRLVKNSRRDVCIDDTDKFNTNNNNIQAVFMIKKINL